jgi:hypothetical protein
MFCGEREWFLCIVPIIIVTSFMFGYSLYGNYDSNHIPLPLRNVNLVYFWYTYHAQKRILEWIISIRAVPFKKYTLRETGDNFGHRTFTFHFFTDPAHSHLIFSSTLHIHIFNLNLYFNCLNPARQKAFIHI